ncbi:HAD family hydrolase [Pararhizobium arenae]|uniref:HAD family hydrolase n=1 Tax=Pararhizobium arenae TaxID=1856850 RepID=UPI00094AB059|nr:HAD family hydrolase [Pararhizobium arenae]
MAGNLPLQKVTTIGFDADDTLWQNEHFYQLTQAEFAALLRDYVEPDHLSERLLAAEKRNLALYGFGIKGFTLSMIETAIEVSQGEIPTSVIHEILNAGREMLKHPVEVVPHAQDTLAALHDDYRLVLITKGDLFDQERKLAASGIGDYFHGIEIVSDKSPQTYEKAFSRHGDGPERSLMVGNSLKSDVLPALEAGSWGVYVPHALTWSYEHADKPEDHPRFHEIVHLGELNEILRKII